MGDPMKELWSKQKRPIKLGKTERSRGGPIPGTNGLHTIYLRLIPSPYQEWERHFKTAAGEANTLARKYFFDSWPVDGTGERFLCAEAPNDAESLRRLLDETRGLVATANAYNTRTVQAREDAARSQDRKRDQRRRDYSRNVAEAEGGMPRWVVPSAVAAVIAGIAAWWWRE